jgi:N-acetylglucosaminyldiphosphoundecaprenol N-acetyl-beta-D-mannosaminyltransferase
MATAPPPRRHLFDLDFVDTAHLTDVVDALMGPQPDDGRLPLVVTPNVDDLVKLQRPQFADLAQLTRSARYVLPDGQPVVWASRWLGAPLTARLTGADLLPLWWAALAVQQRSTVVVAPSAQVADALHPTHSAVTTVVAPRLDASDPGSTDSLADEVAHEVIRHHASVVMTGIGFPHQQRLAQGLLYRLPPPSPLIALLGGSFDLFTGRTRRAPAWMRRHGLEWTYRLASDPRRLAQRYLVDDVAFLPLVWRAKFKGAP